MRRYRVPRVAFVNKCDRSGANLLRVKDQLREKLHHNPVLLQLPIGLEDKFEGVVDLVTMKAVRFSGNDGEVTESEIPAELQAEAAKAREEMLDAASMFSDELTEAILEERVTGELIRAAIRKGTIELKLTPVFDGLGVQEQGRPEAARRRRRLPPDPTEVVNEAHDLAADEQKVVLADRQRGSRRWRSRSSSRTAGTVSSRTCASTRASSRAVFITNMRTKKDHRIGRLARMHADEMEDIDAGSGDIVAMFGIEATRDTFTDGKVKLNMTSMHVRIR